MTGLESFTNSVYFAFFAFFGCSLAIMCVCFLLEKMKEKTKNKKENNNGS
tara:strand:+ start:258 stop:407 length:150 start_codon:yes stop_codon:yes gene_type:complete